MTLVDRRTMLCSLAAAGIGTVTFQRAVVSLAEHQTPITAEMIQQAEWISGIELDETQRAQVAEIANRRLQAIHKLRDKAIDFKIAPATRFRVLADPPPANVALNRSPTIQHQALADLPKGEEALAFLPVTQLSALIRERKISPVELTTLYLDRLRKYDSVLKCVVTYTDDLAMQQAERAEREIQAGIYRGPLHGVPWGAKDLISVPGYPTTWGVPQFRERTIDQLATIAARLEEAGAVLIAKLSLGALAMGDRWFAGMTRSPWNPRMGSSGSSAGSAAAVAAGLVGFAIGSETLGSIITPCRRCGAVGLRPTFGRVSRHGCMPLSWTMDKIGPIARSAEDCALVLAAIHGADGLDPTAETWPLQWPPPITPAALRVGYVADGRPEDEREDLQLVRQLGATLVPVELPDMQVASALTATIDIEGASVFDHLLRQGEVEGWNQWPGIFRAANYITAVDYLRLHRLRSELMQQMNDVMANVDLLVNANDLVITNLTGHPSIVMPSSIVERPSGPHVESILLTGKLFDEHTLLAVASRLQPLLNAYLKHPPMEQVLQFEQQAEQGTEPGQQR